MSKRIWHIDHPLILKAKQEYLTTQLGLMPISIKYKIPYKTLFELYKADDWKLKKAHAVPLAASDELIKHETKQLDKIIWYDKPCIEEALSITRKQINSSLSLLESFKMMLQRKIDFMDKNIESVDSEQVEIISKALETTTKATNQNLDFYYKLVKENQQPKDMTGEGQVSEKERADLFSQ